jgi:hypothetical protein
MTVLACIGIGVGSFALPLPVFFRLARAEHLTPRCVRDLPVTAAVLLMLLSAPTEVTR